MMQKKNDTVLAEVCVSIIYTANSGIAPGGDYEFILEIHGQIQGSDPENDGPEVNLGTMDLYLVRVGMAINEGARLYDVFDTYQETMDLAEVVYDDDFTGFSAAVHRRFEDADPSGDILLLHRLTLDPLVRGQRLGLAAMHQAVRDWSSGCSLVVMKPFPLQFEANAKGSPTWHELRLDRFPSRKKAAFVKLVDYYRPLGFKRLGRSEFFGYCTYNRMVSWEALGLPESYTIPKCMLAKGDLSNQ